MNTKIEYEGKHYELTGEIRPVTHEEAYYEDERVCVWPMRRATSAAYPVLREVEAPKPLPFTVQCYHYPETDSMRIEGGCDDNLSMTVVEVCGEDASYTGIAIERENALDLARRILAHYGVEA